MMKILLSLLLIASFLFSNTVEKAIEEFKKQNFKEGIRILEPLVKKENPNAQIMMGALYMGGIGVERNIKKGINLYKKAANQGNIEGQFFLGKMYFNGFSDIERNYKTAFDWYKKAADKKHKESQFKIASMYFYGQGTKQDYKKSFELYKKLLVHEDPRPLYMIANMYKLGLGIKENHTQALNYFKKAAKKGHENSHLEVANFYYYKEDKRAIKWYEELLKKGNSEAQYKMGHIYENGLLIKRTVKRAKLLYRKAANQNHKGAISIIKNEKKYFDFRNKLFDNKLHDEIVLYYAMKYFDKSKDIKNILITNKKLDDKFQETYCYLTYFDNNRKMFGKLTLSKSLKNNAWIATNLRASSNRQDIK